MSNVVCIDNGSSIIKAGFGAEHEPRLLLNNCVGQTKHASMLVSDSTHHPSSQQQQKQDSRRYSSVFIGDEALARKSTCHLSQPMNHSTVNDWDHMEKVWMHMYQKGLEINPEEHPVLLTYHQNQVTNSTRTMELFFEQFQVPALYIGLQSMYTLLASGRVSGLVIDCGDTMMNAVPFFEGQYLRHAKTQMELGGRQVTQYLARLIKVSGERGANLDPTVVGDLDCVTRMKHRHAFVSQDYEADKVKARESSSLTVSHELPDGTVIELNEERFKCAEVLFDPSKIGLEIDGIHENTCLAIRRSDLDLRRTMYENIVLVGGSSLLEGLDTRLTQELIHLAPANMKIQVVKPEKSELLPWIGMSLYAAFYGLTSSDHWISREMYDEYGADELVEQRLHL